MHVEDLKKRLSIPVLGAPLFIVSNPDLVLAQCTAGIVGSFPALNARPVDVLEQWLQRLTTELAAWDAAHPDRPSAPFAINQIVHKSNNRLEQDLALTVKYQVPIVITSLGAREDLNAAVHGYGGLVFHDQHRERPARRQLRRDRGGSVAGDEGHGGRLRPQDSRRKAGNRITSRMLGLSVSSIIRRSMPMPQPPVGGMPYSSARTKSWS